MNRFLLRHDRLLFRPFITWKNAKMIDHNLPATQLAVVQVLADHLGVKLCDYAADESGPLYSGNMSLPLYFMRDGEKVPFSVHKVVHELFHVKCAISPKQLLMPEFGLGRGGHQWDYDIDLSASAFWFHKSWGQVGWRNTQEIMTQLLSASMGLGNHFSPWFYNRDGCQEELPTSPHRVWRKYTFAGRRPALMFFPLVRRAGIFIEELSRFIPMASLKDIGFDMDHYAQVQSDPFWRTRRLTRVMQQGLITLAASEGFTVV